MKSGALTLSSEPDGREPEPRASSLPILKPLIRPKLVAPADEERTWKETTFLPLPDEDDDVDEDERDLILDAHDILVAARIDPEGDDGEVVHEHSDSQDLHSPIEREEILVEQAKDELCKTVMAEQVGRKGTCVFEDSDGILCRQNLQEPGKDQIMLPSSWKHRVLRLTHYHV